MTREAFEVVAAQARACDVCADCLPHAPQPILQGSSGARIQIISQAPGTRAHASGTPFMDPSGVRLRDWLQLDEAAFYDPGAVAITPMGLCFPGLDTKGGDRPPRPECAPIWQDRLRAALPDVQCTLLIGAYAQRRWLGARAEKALTGTVLRWRDFAPEIFALPHPSWRNNAWLKRNPWFEKEVLPALRLRIRSILGREV